MELCKMHIISIVNMASGPMYERDKWRFSKNRENEENVRLPIIWKKCKTEQFLEEDVGPLSCKECYCSAMPFKYVTMLVLKLSW